jgi:hypothetical protein
MLFATILIIICLPTIRLSTDCTLTWLERFWLSGLYMLFGRIEHSDALLNTFAPSSVFLALTSKLTSSNLVAAIASKA